MLECCVGSEALICFVEKKICFFVWEMMKIRLVVWRILRSEMMLENIKIAKCYQTCCLTIVDFSDIRKYDWEIQRCTLKTGSGETEHTNEEIEAHFKTLEIPKIVKSWISDVF